ncbi:electron transfer flavoprotein subunit alpha/FixB family protein [Streptomyces sp. BH106]|uniref:electron transfer flavoprotein subunit alpha/FixB family protein n=1 Tax=Streptomyces sp. BH106 TaxID=3410409 RepID=UPI003CEA4523
MSATSAEVWVVVVPSARQTEAVSAELLGEAKRLAGSGTVRALVIGHDLDAEVSMPARWAAASVLTVDDPQLATYHPERFARVVAEAIRTADVTAVLFAGTVLGSDLGARVGHELGRRFHGGCVNFDLAGDKLRVVRAVDAGRSHQVELADTGPYLISLIPDTVGGGAPAPVRATVEKLPIEVKEEPTALEDLGFVAADPRTMDIRDADIIVAGGRGVGGAEGFAVLEEVAERLGGSLGASRPAVEAGWAEYERQVGQTGRVVRPKLYVACGISGATQHLAGMREAETIIAVNTDAAAPIHGAATLSVECDLHEVLTALAAQLRARQKGAAA